MIPLKIHYCWFGGRPLPALARRCIESWRRMMPGVEIVRWDESNYACSTVPYVAAAYRAGKWAFVSDYVRLDVIAREGGVYLDVDVELLRSLRPLAGVRAAFVGRQLDGCVNTGLILAAEPNNAIVVKMRDAYRDYRWIDGAGRFSSAPCTVLQTDFLADLGYDSKNTDEQTIAGLTVLRPNAIASENQQGILCPDAETLGIHYGMSSWYPWGWRMLRTAKRMLARCCGPKVLGWLVWFKRLFARRYS